LLTDEVLIVVLKMRDSIYIFMLEDRWCACPAFGLSSSKFTILVEARGRFIGGSWRG